MAERTQRTLINHLIETSRDAERGFRAAARYANRTNTKRLFLYLAEQRRDFAAELLPHAHRLGGASEAEGTAIAKAHRAWLRIRARLALDPERALVREAIRGERYATTAYDDALHDLLPAGVRELVEAQDLSIRVAARRVADLATH